MKNKKLMSSCSVGMRDINAILSAPISRIKTLRDDEERSGFTLCCHPELDSGSCCSIKGFTLIELLVVVLIIGILAAVALPQYQLAVVKSKAKAILPILSAIYQAQEVYYLNNGEYAKDAESLDVKMPAECSAMGSGHTNWVCGTDWHIVTNTNAAVTANYCPGYNTNVYVCNEHRDFSIRWGFNHCAEKACTRPEEYPLKERVCRVRNDSTLGEKICAHFFLTD